MKENIDSNIKMPWFVRCEAKLNSISDGRAILTGLLIGIVVWICACGYLNLQSTVPYEEFYDIAFYTYVNDKLEDVIYEVRDEESGINFKNIPENVSDFNIFYKNDGITIHYSFDNDMIISQYNSETGKNTTQHSFDEELSMKIQMSNEYVCIEKTSFLDEIPSQEEYQKEHNRSIIVTAVLLAFLVFLAIMLGWLCLLFILFILVSIWENAQ